jgi:hypothetical protein
VGRHPIASTYFTRTTKDPKEGKEEESKRHTDAFAYPHHNTHTPVYISYSSSAHTLRISLLEDLNVSKNLMLLGSLYLFWWRFLFHNNFRRNKFSWDEGIDRCPCYLRNGQFTFASDLEVHSMANMESRKHARDFMASFD